MVFFYISKKINYKINNFQCPNNAAELKFVKNMYPLKIFFLFFDIFQTLYMSEVKYPDIEGFKYKVYPENKKIFKTDTYFLRTLTQRHVLSTENYEFYNKISKFHHFWYFL